MTFGAKMAGELPERWKAAYERDRLGAPLYADPRPERLAARALAAFILTGLCFLALPGTLLGVWNLLTIAQRHSSTAASTAWIQAHGQVQLFGWVGTFILGISLYVLPKMQGRSLKRFEKVWAVWALWTVGVTLRWWAGVGARHWPGMLIASGVLELVAYGLTLQVLLFVPGSRERKKPQDLGSWLAIFGFAALGLALLLNLGISLHVARSASGPVYPQAANGLFLLVALWGFAVPVAWGYSTRFVTIFLGLEPPVHRAAKWLCAGVAGVVLLALLRQFLATQLLVLALAVAAVWALRVFRPSERRPKLAGVYSRYPTFVRLAFTWLIVGASLGLLARIFPAVSGLEGAGRHAVTVGFVATLIFAIGPRILPSFLNSRELYSARLMGASLWILNLGCLLRVSSESVAYSVTGVAWSALPVSALLELVAVVIFVVNLGFTLAQPMLAWFRPEGVKDSLPVYWYVSSFPQTRRVLVRAGLETLGRVREVPRSLSLKEAAEADGVDVARLLAELKIFFSRRQPRRVGREARR